MKPVYLDCNATTPLDPEVLEAMRPVFEDNFGNPSSVHAAGRKARVCLDEAREKVAQLLQGHPSEIVFTSGGTESNNFALVGVALALREKGRHLITCEIEHPSVLNPCRQLESLGFQISRLPVDRWGRISLEQLEEAITPATVLISIQHANNEVGTMQPVERIGEIARERGVLFHTDAVQSIGKLPVNVSRIPVDLLSVSAHKMYGPKGVGALFIRRGTPALFSLVCGGSQEKKRRGGTENLPGIVGFGKACELAARRLEEGEPDQIRTLRDYLDRRIRDLISEVQRFGHPESCLPNTLALGFKGTEGETLLIGLDLEGIAVSTGSACSSGSALPSPVLTALGVPHDEVNGSLRFSLGRHHTRQDMDRVAETLARRVALNREKTAAS